MGLGLAAIGLTLAGWSITPVLISYLSGHIDVLSNNAFRYAIAATVWLPVLLIGRMKKAVPEGLMKRALLPSAINVVAQTLFTSGFYLIDPAMMIIGLRMQIVFVALGAAMLFANERAVIRSNGFLVGASLATAGTVGVLVFELKTTAGLDNGRVVLGMLVAIASGAGFGGYGLAVRHAMHGVPAYFAFAAISQYTAGALIALMFAFAPGHGAALLELSGTHFALLIVSAFTGIAGTHVFYYVSIKRLGVAVSTAVLQLQPFGVGIISYAVLGERLSLPQWLCGVVAVLGAGLVLLVQHRMRHGAQAGPDLEDFAELPPDAVAAAVIAECEPSESSGSGAPGIEPIAVGPQAGSVRADD
jgi:drug/metabolite transporter (DMT)-like permease